MLAHSIAYHFVVKDAGVMYTSVVSNIQEVNEALDAPAKNKAYQGDGMYIWDFKKSAGISTELNLQ